MNFMTLAGILKLIPASSYSLVLTGCLCRLKIGLMKVTNCWQMIQFLELFWKSCLISVPLNRQWMSCRPYSLVSVSHWLHLWRLLNVLCWWQYCHFLVHTINSFLILDTRKSRNVLINGCLVLQTEKSSRHCYAYQWDSDCMHRKARFGEPSACRGEENRTDDC